MCARVRERVCMGGGGACVCVCVCVCACTCVSYLHVLLTPIRKPIQHRSSGSVSHFTPTVNTNMGNMCFFCDCITRWNRGLCFLRSSVRSDAG